MFVCHLVDPDLSVEILFEKEGGRVRGCWFWNGGLPFFSGDGNWYTIFKCFFDLYVYDLIFGFF